MFCSNCACELPIIAKFCVRCGARVETSISTAPAHVVPPVSAELVGDMSARCAKCGGHNPSDYSYCRSCGSSLMGPAASVPPLHDAWSVNPKGAAFLGSERAPSRVCATGSILVVPRDSTLPARCVACGNIPTEPWVKITFSWHHPGYYCFLVSPIIYVVVALIVRRRIKLSVPLCKAHKSIRTKRLWIATILLVGCIPLPTIFGVYVGNDAAEMVALWLGVGMFIAG
jgi:hypothetical protein